MTKQLSTAVVVAALSLGAVTALAQSATVTGIFFNEGWESGSLAGSFNSSSYGNSSGSQYRVSNQVRAAGAFAFEHYLLQGTDPGSVQYATQHFGDARTGPVLAAGQGQSFQDLYVQYKVYYPTGFDFSTGYKQLIIGTQDDRRHDNPCCNPWVAHYTTIYTRGTTWLAEANNKQASSGQWVGIAPNQNGYSSSNPLLVRSGQWYTVEVRRRLNDSGDNGIFQMWVDGVLVADHRSVRFRIPYNGSFGTTMSYGTNFVMISDYAYAPVTRNQSIYYDDMKFSTTYIGSGAVPPRPPTNLRIAQ